MQEYVIFATLLHNVVIFKKYSDIEILEGVKKQDDKILKWLYNSYYSMVEEYVIKNSGSYDDAADVLQESIIIIYEKIIAGNLSLTTDLKGFFFGVVKNVWSALLRKKQKMIPLESDYSDEEDSGDIINRELEKIVSKAFAKLKPDQRMILELFAQGKSYAEITELMGLGSEEYARRKKYLSKEALIEVIKRDPEYWEYFH